MNVSTSVNNFLPFSINNVERMRVDTTGNVGILRSDPAYPLDISGTARISNVGNVDGSLLLGSAGLSYTNATNNISLGKTTANTTVGSGNVAVGNSTLSSLTTGTNNVALGYIAGNTITSGSQNVYVGGNTVPSATSATNEIAVGFGATGLGSNTVVLGNSSIATTALRGNVGIGTTAPAFPLDVNGAAKFRSTLDLSTNNITNANQISATTNLVLQPTTGNVGIATTAPAFPLDVSGAARVSTNSTVDGTLYLGSAAVAYQNSTKNVVFGSGSLPPASGSNNVAIGNGTLAALTTGTNNTTIGLNAGTTITTGTGNVYVGAGAAASAVGVSNEIVIGSGTTGLGSNSAVLGNSNIATTILRGNVGIGTTTPSVTLDVSGTTKLRGAMDLSGNNITNASQIQASSHLILQPSSGNVGIGTTAPGYTLDVNGTINCTGNILRNGSVYTGKIIDITQSAVNYSVDYWPGTTWTDSPIPSITITPFSSSSRFLLRANIIISVSPTTTVAFRFVRNQTVIGVGDGGNYQCSFRGQTASTQWANTTSGEYMDSPNTANSISYRIQFMTFDSTRRVRFNQCVDGSGADNNVGMSTFTITELLS